MALDGQAAPGAPLGGVTVVTLGRARIRLTLPVISSS